MGTPEYRIHYNNITTLAGRYSVNADDNIFFHAQKASMTFLNNIHTLYTDHFIDVCSVNIVIKIGRVSLYCVI